MPRKGDAKPPEQRVYTDGRPIQDIALAVFARMEKGESLRQACASEGTFHSAVLRWADESEEIAYHYARAREGLISARFDEMRDVVESASVDHAAIAKAGLIVAHLRWESGKLMPKRSGDRTTLAGDPKAPLAVTTIERVIVREPNAQD